MMDVGRDSFSLSSRSLSDADLTPLVRTSEPDDEPASPKGIDEGVLKATIDVATNAIQRAAAAPAPKKTVRTHAKHMTNELIKMTCEELSHGVESFQSWKSSNWAYRSDLERAGALAKGAIKLPLKAVIYLAGKVSKIATVIIGSAMVGATLVLSHGIGALVFSARWLNRVGPEIRRSKTELSKKDRKIADNAYKELCKALETPGGFQKKYKELMGLSSILNDAQKKSLQRMLRADNYILGRVLKSNPSEAQFLVDHGLYNKVNSNMLMKHNHIARKLQHSLIDQIMQAPGLTQEQRHNLLAGIVRSSKSPKGASLAIEVLLQVGQRDLALEVLHEAWEDLKGATGAPGLTAPLSADIIPHDDPRRDSGKVREQLALLGAQIGDKDLLESIINGVMSHPNLSQPLEYNKVTSGSKKGLLYYACLGSRLHPTGNAELVKYIADKLPATAENPFKLQGKKYRMQWGPTPLEAMSLTCAHALDAAYKLNGNAGGSFSSAVGHLEDLRRPISGKARVASALMGKFLGDLVGTIAITYHPVQGVMGGALELNAPIYSGIFIGAFLIGPITRAQRRLQHLRTGVLNDSLSQYKSGATTTTPMHTYEKADWHSLWQSRSPEKNFQLALLHGDAAGATKFLAGPPPVEATHTVCEELTRVWAKSFDEATSPGSTTHRQNIAQILAKNTLNALADPKAKPARAVEVLGADDFDTVRLRRLERLLATEALSGPQGQQATRAVIDLILNTEIPDRDLQIKVYQRALFASISLGDQALITAIESKIDTLAKGDGAAAKAMKKELWLGAHLLEGDHKGDPALHAASQVSADMVLFVADRIFQATDGLKCRYKAEIKTGLKDWFYDPIRTASLKIKHGEFKPNNVYILRAFHNFLSEQDWIRDRFNMERWVPGDTGFEIGSNIFEFRNGAGDKIQDVISPEIAFELDEKLGLKAGAPGSFTQVIADRQRSKLPHLSLEAGMVMPTKVIFNLAFVQTIEELMGIVTVAVTAHYGPVAGILAGLTINFLSGTAIMIADTLTGVLEGKEIARCLEDLEKSRRGFDNEISQVGDTPEKFQAMMRVVKMRREMMESGGELYADQVMEVHGCMAEEIQDIHRLASHAFIEQIGALQDAESESSLVSAPFLSIALDKIATQALSLGLSVSTPIPNDDKKSAAAIQLEALHALNEEISNLPSTDSNMKAALRTMHQHAWEAARSDPHIRSLKGKAYGAAFRELVTSNLSNRDNLDVYWKQEVASTITHHGLDFAEVVVQAENVIEEMKKAAADAVASSGSGSDPSKIRWRPHEIMNQIYRDAFKNCSDEAIRERVKKMVEQAMRQLDRYPNLPLLSTDGYFPRLAQLVTDPALYAGVARGEYLGGGVSILAIGMSEVQREAEAELVKLQAARRERFDVVSSTPASMGKMQRIDGEVIAAWLADMDPKVKPGLGAIMNLLGPHAVARSMEKLTSHDEFERVRALSTFSFEEGRGRSPRASSVWA